MRADAYVAGFFLGCLFLCFLMLALPEKRICEVSYMKQGGNMTVVHVGVLAKYKD